MSCVVPARTHLQAIKPPALSTSTYVWWGRTWHMQTPLETLGSGSTMVFELRDVQVSERETLCVYVCAFFRVFFSRNQSQSGGEDRWRRKPCARGAMNALLAMMHVSIPPVRWDTLLEPSPIVGAYGAIVPLCLVCGAPTTSGAESRAKERRRKTRSFLSELPFFSDNSRCWSAFVCAAPCAPRRRAEEQTIALLARSSHSSRITKGVDLVWPLPSSPLSPRSSP